MPNLFKLFYPQGIKSFPNATGKLFFTFDDGPNPSVTPYILDILKKFGASATFFCTGENVEKYPEVYKLIINFGHKTGNHSYFHINGFRCSKKNYVDDVNRAGLCIHSKIFRPPYGKMRPSQYSALVKEFKIIFWDVLSYDYKVNLQPIDCVNIVLNRSKSGSIIVFHENDKARDRVLTALPILLDHYTKLGFTFESINFEDQ